VFDALLPNPGARPFFPAPLGAEVAREPWQVQAYFRLRRQIFALEQGLFEGSDRDGLDDSATPIVAQTQIAGMPDRVVGVVRIYAENEGVWFGGRLGVDPSFRRAGAIGSALITEAVSTAHAWGARKFFATVQERNVRYFCRHHFQPLREIEVCGRPHRLMSAELSAYPETLSSQYGRRPTISSEPWQRRVA
jgi:putative N-acetyltransferase (TIGR04045 family)